jgi:hypothetical protein
MTLKQINILPKEDYDRLYRESFVKPADMTIHDLEREWEELRDKLRETLGTHWDEGWEDDSDFMVSDDWAESFHHCAGIYSDRIICPLYVDLIVKVITTMRHKDRWTYHTVVEPRSERLPNAEFFIRQSALYAPKTPQFNYAEVFCQK